MSTFILLTVLAPYRALLAARLFLCLLRRRSLSDSVSSTRPREEWVAYSFDRFIAAIKTRYTPHTRRHVILSHPTTGKKCREPVAFAAADRGDRARRVRGDRHGEAAVIPYDAAGASARACGSVEGSTLGAAEVRRTALHHPRAGVCISYEEACLSYEGACMGACPRSTAPDREWCSS